MKRILMSIFVLSSWMYSCALTQNEGITYVRNYYQLLTEYATTSESVTLAKKIENIHVGNGYVYPDVEIKLGKGMTETEGVGIKSVYLASIVSRQNMLLKFVPKDILLEGNSNGICTMVYILYVYSGNEQPNKDVWKYSVSLRMEIQNSDRKIISIKKNTKSATSQSTLNVSPSNLSFGSSGGTRTITVSSNRDWSISVNTASWGHLTRNGNTLTLTVDNYTGATERTDYFKIKAGDKEERINIRQSPLTQSTLSVSSSNLSFGSSGGTRTITVSSNRDWSISVNTASWGHLTRNGNTLTLTVDNYTGATERTDYFKIKAGDKEERINIKQSASNNNLKPSVKINSITVAQNQNLDDGKGIIIHISFNIDNFKGKNGRVVAYFYDSNGNAIIDKNNTYNTQNGKVATGKNITPSYDNSTYNDLQLKIPYSELHQSGNNNRTIKFSISVWDKSISPNKEIYSSSYTSFTYTPPVEAYLKVDNSTSDKIKNFSESGGRETYYVSTSESSYETWGVPSWCRIENKTSSSFTLVCEPNTTSSQRNDYMKVKAGGKEIRIDIKQEGKSSEAIVENCWLTHNLSKTMWNGYMWINVPYMRIHCHFSVAGHKGEKIRVCAYFYYSNGNRVNAINSEFRTRDGQATVQGFGKCSYDDTLWEDYTLDIPYYALPKGSLSVQVQIQDNEGNYLAESSYISFTVN